MLFRQNIPSAPDDAGRCDFERSQRIRNLKLNGLYRGVFAIPTNTAVALLVSWLISDMFPISVLALWMSAVVAVSLARLEMQRRFTCANRDGSAGSEWGVYYCLGALASGAAWAALCLLLPVYAAGDPGDYVLLIVVAAGMSGGALTTLSPYLPAYLCYVLPFTLAISAVSLASSDPDIAGSGLLILLYAAMIAVAARKINGDITRAVALYVDNQALHSSLTRARRERDDARKDKWSTLAQLSHELRTPLNAIMGYSEIMQTKLFGALGNARYDDYVRHIHSSGEHLLHLADELLLVSQGESGDLKLSESEVDLRRIAGSCLEALAPQAADGGIHFLNAVPHELPPLKADETKLRRMLFNLAGNAIKFTPEGGLVRIAGRLLDGGCLELTIHDTGIGIAPEDIQAALSPFGRVSTPGTYQKDGAGLGLPIVHRLAELHGAELVLESTVGQGTTCTIVFPAERTLESPARDGHVSSAVA